MHYYQFNIGDYAKSTKHLDPIEDLIYRRLLDIYYDTEKPISSDIKKTARLIGLKNNLEGRDVIIVEDIIDSGRTMHYFLESLETKNPKSVAIFTLLHKPTATIFDLNIDYIGFSIEDKFVIGYGLDYDEAGRQYPDIYQLA